MAVTLEGLRSLDLPRLLSSTAPRCYEYSSLLGQHSRDRAAADDPAGAEAALLLGKVCHFYFRPDWPGNPWGPAWYGQGTRTVAAEDLLDEELDALASFAAEIEVPELRARVADVLWECKRGHTFAREAITAYRQRALESEDPLEWSGWVENWSRAADLAASIGRRKETHLEILGQIQERVEKFKDVPESGFLTGRLMQILLGHRHGNVPLNAAICEELAVAFTGLKTWNLATGYWDLASAWHRLDKQEAEAERCQRELGEAMIRRGQDQEDRTRLGSSYSAGWLARGMEVLRRSSADKNRIDELHKELLEQQAAARGEFHTFERPGMEQLEEARQKSAEWMRNHLTGLPLEEAISRFVAAISPSDPTRIRETILGGAGSSLRFAIGVATLDGEGKTAGYVEGQSLATGPTEEQIRAAMFEHARNYDWSLMCDCAVEPGRRIISKEHRLHLRDLAFLVQGNALIPPGHESIYLRGIHAGFHGDFLVASHLLIPQLEQTVRQVIRGYGIVTSTLEGDVQKERDLGWLLTHEKAAEAFGEDLIFDLRGVLIEKFGENLRNNTCHGLIPAEAFYANPGSCYCWWLALRLLWLGIEWTKRKSSSGQPT